MPVLSIVIPTFNRSGHLEKLLHFLRANLLTDARFDLEVVVVDNASTDATQALTAMFDDRSVRFVRRTTHLQTAEENVIMALEDARGRYVWFLGDDDVPVLMNFARHYEKLVAGQHDLFVFNPAIIDRSGTLDRAQNVIMNRHELVLPIGDLVVTIGCLFTIAGISNSIIRRDLLSRERGLHYFHIAPIYSMVAWLIDAASEARCVFVNAPLVSYRENDYSAGHWSNVAARLGIGDHAVWCIGLQRLLEELMAQKRLTPAQVGAIMEVDRNGTRYRLIDEMLRRYHQQALLAASDKAARQGLNADTLAAAARFFAACDPTTFDLVQSLRSASTGIRDARFIERIDARQARGPWLHHICCHYKGYEIIETPVQFTAVLGSDSHVRDAVMRAVDPLPRAPYVVVGETLAQVFAAIDAVGATRSERQSSLPQLPDSSDTTASNRLDAVYASTSWRITAPLRMAKQWIASMTDRRRSTNS